MKILTALLIMDVFLLRWAGAADTNAVFESGITTRIEAVHDVRMAKRHTHTLLYKDSLTDPVWKQVFGMTNMRDENSNMMVTIREENGPNKRFYFLSTDGRMPSDPAQPRAMAAPPIPGIAIKSTSACTNEIIRVIRGL